MFGFLIGMGAEDHRIYHYPLEEPKREECFALSFEARKEGFNITCNCIQIDKLRVKRDWKLKACVFKRFCLDTTYPKLTFVFDTQAFQSFAC